MLLPILFAAGVEVVATEPAPADQWVANHVAVCGDQKLEISQPVHADGTHLTVRMNGKALDLSHDLARELGEPRAAYRYAFTCSGPDDVMQMLWVRGLADENGAVSYRTGFASFRNGEMIEASSDAAAEEDFWYR